MIQQNATLCAELRATKPPRMILCGITGGIGTGKSAVADILASMGYPVMSSDDIAKEIMEQDDVKQEIRRALGDDVIHADGSYNRPAIGALIFGESEQAQMYRERINSITHPRVVRELFRRACVSYTDGHPLIFNESALLFETGLSVCYDAVVSVTAMEALRCERLIGRGMNEQDIRRRMAQQLPQAEKDARATMVIHNNADRSALRHAVEQAVDTLLRMIAKPVAEEKPTTQ
jgi:dephospho-CoA kinase